MEFNTFIEDKFLQDNSPELHRILTCIRAWHQKFPEKDVSSIDEFTVFFYTLFPSVSDRDKEVMDTLLTKVGKLEVEDAIAKEFLVAHIQRARATKTSLLALEVSEGRKPFDELVAEVAALGGIATPDTLASEFVVLSEEGGFPEPGLRWRLQCLNKSLGSLRKGDNGFIFARPEAGKSTFALDQSVYMAEQGAVVLYINNEQPGELMLQRAVQSCLSITAEQFFKFKKQALKKFKEKTVDGFFVYDKAYINRREVDRLCRRYSPGLLVFDQLDKIKGFDGKNERDDISLKHLYQWARELSKEYCPTIGICQAGASAEGKKWLTMDDVDSSKCMGPETPILMYDGTWRPMKEIAIGEQVMGPDSCPRNVLNKASGQEEMFRISHKIGGDSYIVNKSHILTVKNYRGDVVDKPLVDILKYPQQFKGIRSGYQLAEIAQPIDPYWFGMWLGDGKQDEPEITTLEPEIKAFVREYSERIGCTYTEHKNGPNLNLVQAKIKYKQGIRHPILELLKQLGVFKNKHIPEVYFKGSIAQRRRLIAGMLDTDGTLVHRRHYYYSFTNKNKRIAEGLKKLALSVGLMATFKQRKTGYYQVHISGKIWEIPCLVSRKQCPEIKNKRDVLCSRLVIEPLGVGEYCGFTLDRDHRYILDNCIVSHNTAKQGEADWILGIGQSHQAGLEGIRHFNISKNKLLGDSDTDPKLRHGKMDVRIQPEICRFADA